MLYVGKGCTLLYVWFRAGESIESCDMESSCGPCICCSKNVIENRLNAI